MKTKFSVVFVAYLIATLSSCSKQEPISSIGEYPVATAVAGEANCYMLLPNTGGTNEKEVRIPVRIANRAIPGSIGATDVVEAVLIWTDHINKIASNAAISSLTVEGQGESAVLIVKNGSTEGNAIIGAKVNGEIKWSWHIWVVGYAPNPSAVPVDSVACQWYGGNAKPMMNRNLGALSSTHATYKHIINSAANDVNMMGMLYQWGRKDPFPSGKAWNETISETAPNALKVIYNQLGTVVVAKATIDASRENYLSYSINNPLTFLKTIEEPYDWYSTAPENGNKNLWNYNGQKTVYDPCPEGWRVPVENVWRDFDSGGYETTGLKTGYTILAPGSNPRHSIYYDPKGKVTTNPANATASWVCYPISGYRSFGNGDVWGLFSHANGSKFGNWSAATIGNSANGLYFWTQNNGNRLTIWSQLRRGNAYAVRCIQE